MDKKVRRAWIVFRVGMILVVLAIAFAFLLDQLSFRDSLSFATNLDQGALALSSCVGFLTLVIGSILLALRLEPRAALRLAGLCLLPTAAVLVAALFGIWMVHPHDWRASVVLALMVLWIAAGILALGGLIRGQRARS